MHASEQMHIEASEEIMDEMRMRGKKSSEMVVPARQVKIQNATRCRWRRRNGMPADGTVFLVLKREAGRPNGGGRRH